MEKQIFIPKPVNRMIDIVLKADRTDVNFPNTLELFDVTFIGLVNQYLGNKANCKKIVSVVNHIQINSYNEETEGYLITYLESEMIASKTNKLAVLLTII
jgi:hypothetical protein